MTLEEFVRCEFLLTHHTARSAGQYNIPYKITLKPNIFTKTRVNEGFFEDFSSLFQRFSILFPSRFDLCSLAGRTTSSSLNLFCRFLISRRTCQLNSNYFPRSFNDLELTRRKNVKGNVHYMLD
jgi:hypothetical protein